MLGPSRSVIYATKRMEAQHKNQGAHSPQGISVMAKQTVASEIAQSIDQGFCEEDILHILASSALYSARFVC